MTTWRDLVRGLPAVAGVWGIFAQIWSASPAGGGTAAMAAKTDIGATSRRRVRRQVSQDRACRSTLLRRRRSNGGMVAPETIRDSSMQSAPPFRTSR